MLSSSPDRGSAERTRFDFTGLAVVVDDTAAAPGVTCVAVVATTGAREMYRGTGPLDDVTLTTEACCCLGGQSAEDILRIG